MDKILSIVVPTYNMEQYLANAITSLLIPAPLFSLLDIIIVNDGSTDASLSIAQQFAQSYPQNIRIINKTNGNYGSCINSALQIANGKYIKILDADDTFNTDAFTKFVSRLTTESADLVLTNYSIVSQRGRCLKRISMPLTPASDGSLTFAQLTSVAHLMAMHSVCYRTAILIQIGYEQTEGISYTDMEWISWPIIAVKSIKYYQLNLYKYLYGRNGQTVDEQTHLRKMCDEEIGILKNIAQLQSLPSNHIAYNYLKKRIYQRLRSVYHGTLANAPTNAFSLKNFEDKLKATGFSFEEETNSMSLNCIFFRYYLIHSWRKTYDQYALRKSISYKVYHLLRSVRNAYNNLYCKYL